MEVTDIIFDYLMSILANFLREKIVSSKWAQMWVASYKVCLDLNQIL